MAKRIWAKLAQITVHHWLLVLTVWGLVLAALLLFAPHFDSVALDGDLAHLPADAPSVQGERLFQQAFPNLQAKSQVVIVLERQGEALRPTDLAAARWLAERLRTTGDLPLLDVWTRDTDIVGDKLTSPPRPQGQATLLVLLLSNEFLSVDNLRVMERIQQELGLFKSEHAPAGLHVGLSGSAAIGADTLASARDSIRQIEWASTLLIVLILLAVYRAPLLAIIPLAAVACSVVAATAVIAWLAQMAAGTDWAYFRVFRTTRIFLVVVLYGSGTDYCLFLIARMREELSGGQPVHKALEIAVKQTGGALVASGLTTVLGLASMALADFGKFKSSGPAIGVGLLVTLLACLTIAPALLSALGRFAFWPWHVGAAAGKAPHLRAEGLDPWPTRIWSRIAQGVVQYPWTVMAACLLVMAPWIWVGQDTRINYDLRHELPNSMPSMQGTTMLERHYATGEIGPLTILAHRPGAAFDTSEGHAQINELVNDLYALFDPQEPNRIVKIRCLTEPVGDRPRFRSPLTLAGLRAAALRRHPRTKKMFMGTDQSGEPLARFDVVLATDPFSKASMQAFARIEQHLAKVATNETSAWHGASFSYAGTTAGIRDLAAVTRQDQTKIQWATTIAVFVVLLALIRKPLWCLFLIVSVVASYFVTMGFTEAAFQWMQGADYQGLDWKVPIFLFVILVAVGEDYNIYLVSRVLQEQQISPAGQAIERAVVQTGGIISSCGIIMAGSFCGLIFGSLHAVQQLGVALTFGILFDTFLVRPILVPAFLSAIGKKASVTDTQAL